MAKAKKTESVFEKYAHEYDLMTNSASRAKPHEREVLAIINRFRPKSVLDAGCATGLTTMLFAKYGVKAVGLDRSRAMLDIATSTHAPAKLPLEFVQGSFEKLPRGFADRFDLIVCLANSISGVGSKANLLKSLKNFHTALKPGGSLVLQLLNYSAVTEGQIMPIRLTAKGKITYLRFSERVGKTQQLHVIRIDNAPTPPVFEVFRHTFDNFTPAEVTAALKRAGFRRLQQFGKLDFSEKFTRHSRDLVITAQRA